MVAALARGHSQDSRRRVQQHTGLPERLLGARSLRGAEGERLRRGNRAVAVAQATDRMVGPAHKCVWPAAQLRRQLVQHAGCRIGDSLTDSGGVRAAGEEQPHRLGVVGIDKQRARVARVAELVATDAKLAGKGLGEVGLRLCAVKKIIDLHIQVDGGNSTTGQSRRSSALGHFLIEPGALASSAGRADAGRRGGQRAVWLLAAQFQNAARRVHSARGDLRNRRVRVGLF